ncbi:MAG: glycosyltransferase family 39 protein [Gemmatimonadota bacterium]
MAADPTPLRKGGVLGAGARAAWIGVGLVLAALAVALPSDLAPPVPVAPIDGATLARIAFSLTALAAITFGALGRSLPRVGATDRLRLPTPEGLGSVRHPLVWLTAITALAAALRFYALGGSLWFDEVITVFSASRPFLELFTAPTSLNNHLLHTFLVRGMIEIAGPHEWAIRLPAVVFGVATVPAVYGLARIALRQREALLAALLVATSYHHVLFSQNSRGYAALIFWIVLATWFFLRALTADRTTDWVGFAAASFLGGATVLVGGFALVGQALAVGLIALQIRRAGGNPWPITVKSLVVILGVGLVLLDLYALALPRLYWQVSPGPRWRSSAGPTGFWYELDWGLAEGFGEAGIRLLGLLIILLIPGAILFARRHPAYCALLCAPVTTLGAAVLLIGLYAMPRYFLWALVPFAIGIVGASAVWPRRATRWAAPVLVTLVTVGSLMALRSYYAIPFQASRESLEWVLSESSPGDVIVAVGATGRLVQFYGPRVGLHRSRTVYKVDQLEQLLSIERTHPDHQLWLLTTQWLFIEIRAAPMSEYIDRCYLPIRRYLAKVHRMEITVWMPRCRDDATVAR